VAANRFLQPPKWKVDAVSEVLTVSPIPWIQLRAGMSSPMRNRPHLWQQKRGWLLAVFLAVGVAGCGPKDPLDEVLSATTPVDLTFRRSHFNRTLTPEQVRDFDQAIIELKYDIMAFDEAKGSDAITSAMLEKIHRLKIREIIGLGFSARLRRLEVDRAKLQQMLNHNTRLRTRPGDFESADFLKNVNTEQGRRLEKIIDDIEQIRSKLAALQGVPAHSEPIDPVPIPPKHGPGNQSL